MRKKLLHEFSHGKSKVRDSLCSVGGPFHGLTSKLKIVYTAGWIDEDTYTDISNLRTIRNKFAHSIEPASLDEKYVIKKLDQLRTPHRVYTDWGKLKAGEVENGVMLYTGKKPLEIVADLKVPGVVSLKLGIPALIGVLFQALNISVSDLE